MKFSPQHDTTPLAFYFVESWWVELLFRFASLDALLILGRTIVTLRSMESMRSSPLPKRILSVSVFHWDWLSHILTRISIHPLSGRQFTTLEAYMASLSGVQTQKYPTTLMLLSLVGQDNLNTMNMPAICFTN